jgi:chemotaxis response regulator CheB
LAIFSYAGMTRRIPIHWTTTSMNPLPIVCLGSSAGGLEALIVFFKRMEPT